MTEEEKISANSPDCSTLEYLVRSLRLTRANEEAAKKQRIIVEDKIAVLVPGPERGQKTVKLSDGSSVTVERGFNYKADCDKISELFSAVNKFAPIKLKTTKTLDETGYEWIRDNDEAGFVLLSGLVTVTPKKVAVTIRDKK